MNVYKILKVDIMELRIAYGCMGIGGRWNREPMTADERKAAIDVVAAAFEQGINFFDHADIYTLGKSEDTITCIPDI